MKNSIDESSEGENLVFLISQPRSGSTLLQRILAGHSLIQTSAEPWLMLHPTYALRRVGLQAEYDAAKAYVALKDFLEYYADGEDTFVCAVRAWANVLYGRALQGESSRFFLDKTPRYYFILPELVRVFPRAYYIILFRNPLAVLYSIIQTWVQGDWPMLAGFRHDLLTAPQSLLEGIDLLQNRAIVVHYESLVNMPEIVVQRICSWLEIDYQPHVLEYGASSVPLGQMGDRWGVPRHSRPSTVSLDNWRHLALSQQNNSFAHSYLESLGSEVVEKMGYSYQELKSALDPSTGFGDPALVPWRIAIRPSQTWSRSERLTFYRATEIQRSGIVRGTLSFLGKNAIPLLGWLISRAK